MQNILFARLMALVHNMNPYAKKAAKVNEFLIDFERRPSTPEAEAAKWKAWAAAMGTVND